MDIDVLINSCARIDVLEKSLYSFNKFVKSSHKFRYVILEDKVEDESRQKLGRDWIEKHKDMFDEIHYSEKILGYGYYFQALIKLCTTPYFIHVEDDNEFIKEINIDPMIEVLKNHKRVASVVFRRNRISNRPRPNHKSKIKIVDGIELTKVGMCSVATGMFNIDIMKKLFDDVGWENHLWEGIIDGGLGKSSNILNYKKYVIGHDLNDYDYQHIGPDYGYSKGEWKNE